MIATSGFLTALECTKFVFGRGFAPDPAGELTMLPDPLAGLRRPTSKEREWGRKNVVIWLTDCTFGTKVLEVIVVT